MCHGAPSSGTTAPLAVRTQVRVAAGGCMPLPIPLAPREYPAHNPPVAYRYAATGPAAAPSFDAAPRPGAAGTLGLCLQNAGGRVVVDGIDPLSPNSAAVRAVRPPLAPPRRSLHARRPVSCGRQGRWRARPSAPDC